MKTVEQIIADLIEREGPYVDHPSDKGGPTIWGITWAVAKAFGYKGDLRAMTKKQAAEIYTLRFWIQPRFSLIAPISESIAEEMFDTGVNMGTSTAGKFLQRALNALNQRGRTFPDIAVDGAVGNMTLEALREFIKVRGTAGERVILNTLNAQQSVRYLELSEANPTQEDFQYGWQLNRVGALV